MTLASFAVQRRSFRTRLTAMSWTLRTDLCVAPRSASGWRQTLASVTERTFTEDVRERMLLHMKGRGQNGGLRVAQTVPKEKWRHPDAEKVYQGKTEKDKFFFKAEVDLLPRAGLPMWCSRSTREHWR